VSGKRLHFTAVEGNMVCGSLGGGTPACGWPWWPEWLVQAVVVRSPRLWMAVDKQTWTSWSPGGLGAQVTGLSLDECLVQSC
jgi:hypothetical protein